MGSFPETYIDLIIFCVMKVKWYVYNFRLRHIMLLSNSVNNDFFLKFDVCLSGLQQTFVAR